MSVLVLGVGLVWLVVLALMGFEARAVVIDGVYVLLAAAAVSAPWPLGRTLALLYVGAAVATWVALSAPMFLFGVLLAWLWGTVAFIGLFMVPLMAETLFAGSRATPRS